MNESVSAVAYDARNKANDAHNKIEAHEDLCAERYQNINTSIAEIKSILKWAGSTLFTLVIGVLGWSVVQQINANGSQRQALEYKVQWLEQQRTAPAAHSAEVR